MTDAERLAKAWHEARHDRSPLEAFQHLIDSGVVTVNPPPDPAEQIAKALHEAFIDHAPELAVSDESAIRRLIFDGWIVPGPACEGVELDPVTAAEREVIAAAEDWEDDVPGYVQRMHDAVRALREARS